MKRFNAGSLRTMAAAVVTLGIMLMNPGRCAAQVQGVTFAISTDKEVYSAYEPIRIEVSVSTSTDAPPVLGYASGRYSLNAISVVDVATNQIVLFGQSLQRLVNGLPGNGQVTFGVTDLAPYRLLGGNKKYQIIAVLVVPLICDPTGRSCPQIYTNASTVITVR